MEEESNSNAPHPDVVHSAEEKRFQLIVVITTALFGLCFLWNVWEHRFVGENTLTALSWIGSEAILELPYSVYWLNFFLQIAIAIGLYHFSANARLTFLWFTIFWTLCPLISGITVSTPFPAFMATLFTMGDGAILILAYGTPLRTRFR